MSGGTMRCFYVAGGGTMNEIVTDNAKRDKSLGETSLLIDDRLDLEEKFGLPVVELGDLVVLDDVRREGLDVALLLGISYVGEELGLARGRERDV